MDKIAVSNDEGTRQLLALKLRIKERPVVYLGINNRGGLASHTIHLSPRSGAFLADWLLEPLSEGWNFEPGLIDERQRPAVEVPMPAPVVPDLRGEKAGLVCYVLNVLAWKLPADHGPAWLAGELAAAGIPIEWDSQEERFVAKPLVGGVVK
jgi:hypothetical protein